MAGGSQSSWHGALGIYGSWLPVSLLPFWLHHSGLKSLETMNQNRPFISVGHFVTVLIRSLITDVSALGSSLCPTGQFPEAETFHKIVCP